MEWEVHWMQWPITMEEPLPLEIMIMIKNIVITVPHNTEVAGGTKAVIILTSMANMDLVRLK